MARSKQADNSANIEIRPIVRSLWIVTCVTKHTAYSLLHIWTSATTCWFFCEIWISCWVFSLGIRINP